MGQKKIQTFASQKGTKSPVGDLSLATSLRMACDVEFKLWDPHLFPKRKLEMTEKFSIPI